MTILTEPHERQTLSLCQIIKYSNTTKENKKLATKLENLEGWYRRDNIETVSPFTKLLD